MQMKMTAMALVILWLVGLTAAILARRHRQTTADAHYANRPLIVYLVSTGCVLLVAGVVYYERRKKSSDAAAPVPSSEDPAPEESTPPAV